MRASLRSASSRSLRRRRSGLSCARTRSRRAFSLFEIVLVVAVLAMIAAIIYPAFEKPLAGQRLHRGADQVRSAFMSARIEAMSTGLVHAFRYLPASGEYRIEKWEALDAAIEGDGTEVADAPQTLNATDFIGPNGSARTMDGAGPSRPGLLPDTVRFVADEVLIDARAEATEGTQDTSTVSSIGTEWSQPILFYPDGTTSTARVLLQGTTEERVVVELRGLTGVATVSDVEPSLGPEI